MKTAVNGSGSWWAVEDSNLRPPRCQRLYSINYRAISMLGFSKAPSFWLKVRKIAQELVRKLCQTPLPINSLMSSVYG
jgi:hypothetical protein